MTLTEVTHEHPRSLWVMQPELLLGQSVQPRDGFQCPLCGFAFATVVPAVAARVMVAQAALITALAQLESMTGDRDAVLDAAATPGRVAPAQAEDTPGGPGLLPGGPSLRPSPALGSQSPGGLACLPAPRRSLAGKAADWPRPLVGRVVGA
jgi:hypothetical protein